MNLNGYFNQDFNWYFYEYYMDFNGDINIFKFQTMSDAQQTHSKSNKGSQQKHLELIMVRI